MGLGFIERRERHDPCRQGVHAPARPPLEELRPRGAENEEWDVSGPRDEVLDEVEHGVVGPVQILEHEHGRSVLCQVLDELPPRCEGFGLAVAEQRSACVQADQRAHMALDPAGLVVIAEQQFDGLRELDRRGLCLERVGQARLRP